MGGSGSTVATIGSGGSASFQGGVSTGLTPYNTPGTLTLYAPGASNGSLSLQAPAVVAPSVIWTLPSGTPSAGSILSFSGLSMSTSTLSYTTVVPQGGITVTPSPGMLTIGLGSA